jgi:uncharacterized membrane protein YfcA
MTSDKIHNIAKAFFYTWLVLAASTALYALGVFITRFILPEYIALTFGFCLIWWMCYLYVDARAKNLEYKKDIGRRLTLRTDGKVLGD